MPSLLRAAKAFAVVSFAACTPQLVQPEKLPTLPPGVSAQQYISAAEGGVIEVVDDPELKGTKVIIPAGALDKDTLITVAKVDHPPENKMDGSVEAGPAVQFGPEGTQFKLPVEVRLPYSADDLKQDGLTVKNAFPHYHNPNSGVWEKLDAVSPDSGTIGAKVMHFSTYRIYGITVMTLDDVIGLVTLTPSHRYLLPGQTYQFTAATYSRAGAKIEGADITWRSSNAEVLSVSSTGLATAITYGTATIFAKAEAVEGSAVGEVVSRIPTGPPPKVRSIWLSGSYGVNYWCNDVYDPDTDQSTTLCNENLTVFAGSLADHVTVEIEGSFLYGQDGPDASLGRLVTTFPSQSGGQAPQAFAWSDWSMPEEPGAQQTVSYEIPVDAINGMLRLDAPGGVWQLPFVGWTKAVVIGVGPDRLTPCELGATPAPHLGVYGANFSAPTVKIGGTSHTVTDAWTTGVDVELTASTPSGSVVVQTPAGSSDESAAALGFDASHFERYEGPVVFDVSPHVVIDETSITFRGCGLAQGQLLASELPEWTWDPETGQDVPPAVTPFTTASATSFEVVSIGLPPDSTFLGITTPTAPEMTEFRAFPRAQELVWSTSDGWSTQTAVWGQDVFVAHSSFDGYKLTRLRFGQPASETTISGDGTFSGGKLIAVGATAFYYIGDDYSGNVRVSWIDANFDGGTAVATTLYDLTDASLVNAVGDASHVYLFLSPYACCYFDTVDVLRGSSSGGSQMEMLGSEAVGEPVLVDGSLLYLKALLNETTMNENHVLYALPATAAGLSQAHMVTDFAASATVAVTARLYWNAREAKLYVKTYTTFYDEVSFDEYLIDQVAELTGGSLTPLYATTEVNTCYYCNGYAFVYADASSFVYRNYMNVLRNVAYDTHAATNVWVDPYSWYGEDDYVLPFGPSSRLYRHSDYYVQSWGASGNPEGGVQVLSFYRKD